MFTLKERDKHFLCRVLALIVLAELATCAGCNKPTDSQTADSTRVAMPEPAPVEGTAGSTENREVYLSELHPNRSSFFAKRPALLNGTTCVDSLIGTASSSRVKEAVYTIGRNYSRFRCQVGVLDTESKLDSKVTFRILGDGTELYTSGGPVGIGSPQEVDVDVSGILTLQLQATSDSGMAHIAWGNARLIR